MKFFKNLVGFFGLILAVLSFGVTVQAAERQCVLAPSSEQHLGPNNWFVDEQPVLRISHDAAGNRYIMGDQHTTYYFIHKNSDPREGRQYWNSGFPDNTKLQLPAQFEYYVTAYRAVNTIEGLVLGSMFSKVLMATMQNAQSTGDENDIIKLHQQFTGKELFLTAPIISATSSDSFQVDVRSFELTALVNNIAVTVKDFDWHNPDVDPRRVALQCFVDGAKGGDTIRIINTPNDRTLYIEAYSYVSIDGSYNNVAESVPSLGRIDQPTVVLPTLPPMGTWGSPVDEGIQWMGLWNIFDVGHISKTPQPVGSGCEVGNPTPNEWIYESAPYEDENGNVIPERGSALKISKAVCTAHGFGSYMFCYRAHQLKQTCNK